MKRKICVVSTSRADYGLLFWLLKEIEKSRFLELSLLLSGSHLEERLGLTYKEVQRDFKHFYKVPLGLENDDETALCLAFSAGVAGFSKVLEQIKPDIMVLLGDRYEMLSAGVAGMLRAVPLAHIHGGESTQGAIDEGIRHALTKMSHIHFCATSLYKKRIIQLGENPARVYNVGGLGVENIKRLELLSKKDFENSLGFKLGKKNILVTFHPQTIEKKSASKQFSQILNALDSLKDTHFIFTGANADNGGKIINEMTQSYCLKNPKKAIFVMSLGQLRYLSAIKHADIVLGNSSSGISEAPSLKKATINIGNRQKGRIKAASIIDTKCDKSKILKAIKKAYSKDFQAKLKSVKNPYDSGFASKKIIKVLENIKLNGILKKKFYDLDAKCIK
ncbi:MAG: UDP-N-acetylglucosamine 2-epimerase [Campylobacter sp.]|uniref:UDP-N-acetylglucosamine 2-epimerase n=1 Tax=Campylobacter sp. TaxID=205 RepID=UPI002AA806A1|nr:UDP-N-acetylglucosamine 2-epimerase [Campylobacter sp.]MCI6177399.1 UDP-N-acetylglucosamine 2-epimerase [Campylobacter sp.]